MDLFRQNLRLDLVRPDLNGLPEAPLPPGFSFRWFRRGDAAHWLLIHHDADPFNDITPDLFTRQFGVDLSRLEDRQLFVQDDIGRVVGTATAWPPALAAAAAGTFAGQKRTPSLNRSASKPQWIKSLVRWRID